MKAEKKGWINFIIILVLMMVIVGCSSNSKSNENRDQQSNNNDNTEDVGGEVVIAYDSDISHYDPIKGSSGYDNTLLWPVYDTLITFTKDLQPQPGLAESWTFEDDKTLVLNLREEVTFHDGTPFNAEAVKFNIERTNSDESIVNELQNISSVVVVDEKTVKLHLSQPDSSILLALSDRGGMMVSPSAVEEMGEDFQQSPVGTGAYKMVKRVPSNEIVLEAYEDYWQEGQPYLDKITIKIMLEENTRINALKSGEVDFATKISPGNAASLENDSNITLLESSTVEFRLLYVNASQAPLDNKEVRKAIQYGINRGALIQAINFGKGEPAYQPFPKEYWPADPDLTIEYNPEKARQILKDAGLENISFQMNYFTNAYQQRIAEAIKGQLSEIGITVELNTLELNAAIDNYFAEKGVPLFQSVWTGRPDPQMTISYLFNRDSFFNAGDYSTEEIEDLILKAAGTYEQEDRAEIYRTITQKAVIDEAIIIPLFFTPAIDAMNNSIKGFEQNLSGKPIFSTIRKEE